MDLELLAKNLQYQRKLQGISQEKLAEKAGITVRTIQRIEGRKVCPHMHTVQQLAEALGIQVDELLPLENPKEETIQLNWLLLIHSLPLLGIFLPMLNIVAPVFVWLYKRNDNPVYNTHGRAVVNFQLTVTAVFLICLALMLLFPWLPIQPNFGAVIIMYLATIALNAVFIILNIGLVLAGKRFFYPLAIPFISKSWQAKTIA